MIDLHICDQNYMKFLAVGLLATTAAPYTNCKLWTIHIRLDASVCGEKLQKLYVSQIVGSMECLTLQIIGTTTTYLVILVQFDLAAEQNQHICLPLNITQ